MKLFQNYRIIKLFLVVLAILMFFVVKPVRADDFDMFELNFEPGFSDVEISSVEFAPGFSEISLEPIVFSPGFSEDVLEPIEFTPGTSDITLTPITFTPGTSAVTLTPITFTPGTSAVTLTPITFTPGTSAVTLTPITFTPGTSAVTLTPITFTPGTSAVTLNPITFTPGSSFVALNPITFTPGFSAVPLNPINPGSTYGYGYPSFAGPAVALAAVPATGLADDPRIILFIFSILGLGAGLTYFGKKVFLRYGILETEGSVYGLLPVGINDLLEMVLRDWHWILAKLTPTDVLRPIIAENLQKLKISSSNNRFDCEAIGEKINSLLGLLNESSLERIISEPPLQELKGLMIEVQMTLNEAVIPQGELSPTLV